MFSGWDSPSHWLVLAVVVMVLFGYKKLPEMSRSVGRSLRIFKTEMKGLNDDDEARDSAEKAAAPAPPAVQPAVPVNPPAVTPQDAQTAPVSTPPPATPIPPVAAPSQPASDGGVPSSTQTNN